MLISPPGPSRPTNTHVLVYAGDLRENHQSSVENPDDFAAGNGHWGRWGLHIDGGQGCVLMVFQEVLGTVLRNRPVCVSLGKILTFSRSALAGSLFPPPGGVLGFFQRTSDLPLEALNFFV